MVDRKTLGVIRLVDHTEEAAPDTYELVALHPDPNIGSAPVKRKCR